MALERLGPRDVRLILICVLVSAASLYVGVRYFFKAFPEASIEFRTTRESSLPIAREFLARAGRDVSGYRHASIFGFDNAAKTFLERELGVEDSSRLLETTVRLWRWQHRWFRPLQKEEVQVDVTTKGEIVGLRHLIEEGAAGPNLSPDEARDIAEQFLVRTMERRLEDLDFVKDTSEKRPNRTDHEFTWKLRGSDVRGADYRIAVGVSGDRPTSYEEFLKVPDSWERDYASLRAKNEVAGQADSMLLLLTAVAMLVVLVLRIIRGDVRWKAAAILGTITFVLQLVSNLNEIPAGIYDYDTTTSFSGFLVGAILESLLVSLSFGAAIFIIAASAETLYRQRFPRFLSVSSLLRPRAFRSREFFIASLVGITLTFFFFAYENVFYIIAHSLGAWSPRDVPYSDLLSTAFPWAFVLFIGWFPAISEEFISRMFSIPFLERSLGFAGRLRLPIAMVASAFIWGFGHAAYPNQPWWIRGLEVGLAGIVFGLVMFRFGILSVVICHFSVDALYTAFVLIRSPNLYYVVTGSLAAGVFVILFLAAAAAYALKGGFLPADVTNEEEGTAAAPAPEGAVAEEVAAPAGAWRYAALGRHAAVAGLLIAAALVALRFVPRERWGDWVDFGAGRAQAQESAAGFLAGSGFDVSSYQRVSLPMDRTNPTAAAYLLRNGGVATAEKVYRDLVPTPIWRVRFYVPGQHEEYSVSIDTRDGAPLGFSRMLPDDEPGASLGKAEALAIAERFVEERQLDLTACELKEQSEEEKKARRDHELVWECPIEGADQAKVRYEVSVQGDAVGAWVRGVKLPEEWERSREEENALTTTLRFIMIPFVGLLSGLAIVLFIVKIRERAIPWKFGLLVGGFVGIIMVVLTVNQMQRFWLELYQTSSEANLFRVSLIVIVLVTGILLMVAGTVVGSIAGAICPEATSMFSRASRRLYAIDALLAGLVAAGIWIGFPALVGLVGGLVPGGRVIEDVPWPQAVGASSPIAALLFGQVYRSIFLPAIGGITVALLTTYLRTLGARIALSALFVVSFLPSTAREPAEYLRSALELLLILGAAIVLVRYFLRNNPLAWLWSAWFAPGVVTSAGMISQSASVYRWAGWGALAITIAPGLLLLWDAATAARGGQGHEIAAASGDRGP